MYNFSNLKEKTNSVKEWLQREFSGIRTGRATPTILDVVSVESYGTKMPINQLASIATEGPRSLRIAPWDVSQTKAIEKAIVESDLGLSVAVDDTGLRITFPELTAERRQSLLKVAKQKLEDARVSLRSEREKTWADIQAKEDGGEVSEDDKFRLKNDMQKIIDDSNKELDAMFERKEKEILEK